MLLRTLFILAVAGLPLAAQNDWPMYGHDSAGLRHSPLTQITPQNVRNLKPAWTFHGGGKASEARPIVVGGVMYVTQPKGIFALEPETGKALFGSTICRERRCADSLTGLAIRTFTPA